MPASRQATFSSRNHLDLTNLFPAATEVELPDILKILRLLEELGDIPYLIDDYDLSPAELRSHIELVVHTRQSVNDSSRIEPEAFVEQMAPTRRRIFSGGSE